MLQVIIKEVMCFKTYVSIHSVSFFFFFFFFFFGTNSVLSVQRSMDSLYLAPVVSDFFFTILFFYYILLLSLIPISPAYIHLF